MITNSVTIGDVTLTSNKLSIEELISNLIKIFDNDNIKNYLDLIKSKRAFNGGNYFG